MDNKLFRIEISYKTILTLLVLALAVYAAWQVRSFILVLLTSVVIAAFIEAGTRAFAKIRVPRILAVVLMYAIGLGILVGIFYVMVPIFMKEVLELIDLFPTQSRAGMALKPVGEVITSASSAKDLALSSDPVAAISRVWNQFSALGFMEYAGNIFGGLFNAFLVFVFSFYLAITDRGIDMFLRAVTPVEYEGRVVGLWHRTEHNIRQWFKGQVLIAFIVSLLTYIGLLLLGAPYALLLALISFLFEFIPFGIILAVIPAVLVAVLGGGWGFGLLVAGLYFVIQQLENYVFQPLVTRRTTGIPSIIVLVAVLAGVKLMGVYGLFLSIPIAVFVRELIADRERAREKELES